MPFLTCGENEVKKMKQKKIYCPRCGRKIATYDGKQTIDIKTKCNKCNKIITYYVASGSTVVSNAERTTSSGMRFY